MRDYLIDLHTHSSFSDGELSPIELCDKAKKSDVGILSITDHNTLEGCKSLIGKDLGVKFIPGVEFDVDINFGKLHILGYDVDVNNESLDRISKRILKIQLEKFRIILDKLKKDYAISFDDSELNTLISSKFQVGKMDIALLLLKHGYVNSNLESFLKYINPILDDLKFTTEYPSFEEIIPAIRRAGGVSSLAHPVTLNRNYIELLDLIKKLKGVGLNAIEVYHSSHSNKQVEIYKDLAIKNGLLMSGGSDYHGILTKPNIELGTGADNLNIKYLSLLKKIK